MKSVLNKGEWVNLSLSENGKEVGYVVVAANTVDRYYKEVKNMFYVLRRKWPQRG